VGDAVGVRYGPACVRMPSSGSDGREVGVIFITGMVMGLVLYVIGSVMERHERAQREREWRDRWRK
jgi:hypothetical protein